MRSAGLRGASRGRRFVTTRRRPRRGAAAGPGRPGLHRRRPADWRPGTGPTLRQADATIEAQRHIARAKAALDKAAR